MDGFKPFHSSLLKSYRQLVTDLILYTFTVLHSSVRSVRVICFLVIITQLNSSKLFFPTVFSPILVAINKHYISVLQKFLLGYGSATHLSVVTIVQIQIPPPAVPHTSIFTKWINYALMTHDILGSGTLRYVETLTKPSEKNSAMLSCHVTILLE